MLALGDEGEEFDLQVGQDAARGVAGACRAARERSGDAARWRSVCVKKWRPSAPRTGFPVRHALSRGQQATCERAAAARVGLCQRAPAWCRAPRAGARSRCMPESMAPQLVGHGPAGPHAASMFAAARAWGEAAGGVDVPRGRVRRLPWSPRWRRVQGADGAFPLCAGHGVTSARARACVACVAPPARPNARRAGLCGQVHGRARCIHRGC